MPLTATVRMYHMGATKSYLLRAVVEYGPEHVLRNWTGTTEEALQAIRDDAREVFCDCDCVKDETGACTGVANSTTIP